MHALRVREGEVAAWDDVTNAALDPTLVAEARRGEMRYFEEMRVSDRVPRAHQKSTGGKIIRTRWIDINKGDASSPKYRSRLVGKGVPYWPRRHAVQRDAALGGAEVCVVGGSHEPLRRAREPHGARPRHGE